MSSKVSRRKRVANNKHRRKGRKQQSMFSQNQLMMLAGLAVVLVVLFGGAALLLGGDDNDGSTTVVDLPETGALPSEVNVNQGFAMREDGVFVVDVREEWEWNDFHIPGTTLIPLGELASRVDELPQDQDILVVCNSGNRSQSGRDILLQAGFERVTSMDGGVSEWRSVGYPIE